jgi:hypothetical protein
MSTLAMASLRAGAPQQKHPAHVAEGSIASFERCRHVCFTPNYGCITAMQRTDALGQDQNLSNARKVENDPRTSVAARVDIVLALFSLIKGHTHILGVPNLTR